MSGAGTIPMAREVAITPPVPYQLPDLADVPDEIEAAITHFVVRTYPDGGWQHEHAIRLSLRLGWAARHRHPNPPERTSG